MHDVDVFFVTTFRAFATANARYQFGSRTRRPKLNYFAQRTLIQTSSLLFIRWAALDLRSRSESKAIEPDKTLGIGLAIAASLLKARHRRIIQGISRFTTND